MPYRKKTLRKMPEHTRKLAKALDDAILALRRAKKEIEALGEIEWQHQVEARQTKNMAHLEALKAARPDAKSFFEQGVTPDVNDPGCGTFEVDVNAEGEP
jgi:hypothetical protein